jgi:hypothetical protein
MTLDPASAVAAAKCLTARLWTPSKESVLDPGAFHPRPCAWEDYTRPELVRMLHDFNLAVGYDDRSNRYEDPEVQRFRTRADQSALVRTAQYPEDGR